MNMKCSIIETDVNAPEMVILQVSVSLMMCLNAFGMVQALAQQKVLVLIRGIQRG